MLYCQPQKAKAAKEAVVTDENAAKASDVLHADLTQQCSSLLVSHFGRVRIDPCQLQFTSSSGSAC